MKTNRFMLLLLLAILAGPAISCGAPPPPAPTGTVVFHTKADGVDRLFHVDPNSGTVTPFLDRGGGEMDLTLDDFGTNARLGEFFPDRKRVGDSFGAARGRDARK